MRSKKKKKKNDVEIGFLLFSASLVQMMKDLKWKQLFYTHSLKGTEPFYAPPPPPLKSATHSTANICCFFFVLLFLNIHFNHSQISKTWFEIHTGCKFNHIKKTKNRKIQSAGKERQKQGKRLYCSWYHHLWFFFFSQILKSTGAFATNTTKSYLK